DPIPRTLLGLALLDAAKARTGRDVVEHALPRKDRVDLEDVADITSDAPHRCAADQHVALARWLEPRDQSERRRLAAARGPDDRAELAVPDREIEVAKCRVRRTRRRQETLGHMPKLDRRRWHSRHGTRPPTIAFDGHGDELNGTNRARSVGVYSAMT